MSDTCWTSWVWNHFHRPRNEDPLRAECQLCKKTLVYKMSLSALSKHLRNVRKLEETTRADNENREEEVDTPDDKQGSSGGHRRGQGVVDGRQGEQTADCSSAGPAPKRPCVAVQPCTQERQEAVSQAIALLIAACQLPISIVDALGFTTFMKPANTVPSAETMRRRLHALYDQVRDDVAAYMKSLEVVSLITDCWTSRALDSYMSLTAQAITKAWRLCRFTLCTESIDVSHTGDNLAMALIDMCHSWDLETRTTSITRDNTSNIKSAVDLVDFVEFNVSCAAHSLQLCVNDALKSNSTFKTACKKAMRVVAHFHHSTKATTALERAQSVAGMKESKLVQSCATRWDSTFFMSQRLVESRGPVRAVLGDRSVTTTKQAKALQMSAEEWEELEAMLPVLKPLQVANTVLCADDKVTISAVRPIVRSLDDIHFKDADDADLVLDPSEERVRAFKVEVKSLLKERFKMDASPDRPVL
ncbi:Zinc finger BED domain-containing protein 4, partial [Frankliniella fusca]